MDKYIDEYEKKYIKKINAQRFLIDSQRAIIEKLEAELKEFKTQHDKLIDRLSKSL